LDKENAKACLDRIVNALELLGECKPIIQRGSSDSEESKLLLTSLGTLIGDVFDQLIGPIVAQHPELMPPQLADEATVNRGEDQ
jgi:hypothetical protein